MLFYCPLESYRERYTYQLSAPDVGWFERNWRKKKIQYVRVDPNFGKTSTIRHGQVLDATNRSKFCFEQVVELLCAIDRNELYETDVIYFDDFWHPGVEAIRYAFDAMGKKPPKMYAYCWAQSADEYDFTRSMQSWIRHFERGISEMLDGVFVANTLLKGLLVNHKLCQADKIHVVGLPFDSAEVKSRMDFSKPRENKVVFSSRWDAEKQPLFFCKVAEEVISRDPTVKFVVTTSASKLRSNRPELLEAIQLMLRDFPNNFELKEGLSKEQYYQELTTAKVQFNCALQDWVSFTLLEASAAGCIPVYPNFRSFPETFGRNKDFMYEPCSVEHAATLIIDATDAGLHSTLFTPHEIEIRSWIHRRMDDTWKRILYHMNLWGEMRAGDNWIDPYQPYIMLPKG